MHKKLYTALIAIAILIAIMAVQLIFGQNSIPRQQRVKENIARYQEEIDSLQKVIDGYKHEIGKSLPARPLEKTLFTFPQHPIVKKRLTM